MSSSWAKQSKSNLKCKERKKKRRQPLIIPYCTRRFGSCRWMEFSNSFRFSDFSACCSPVYCSHYFFRVNVIKLRGNVQTNFFVESISLSHTLCQLTTNNALAQQMQRQRENIRFAKMKQNTTIFIEYIRK